MSEDDNTNRAEAVSRSARDRDITVAVAESLTCGLLVSTLGRADNASQWLRGGVVAYSTDVKRSVLSVSPGPVVSAQCAEEMAAGVASLLEANVTVATTGVGGPEPEEGHDPGTVYIGWSSRGITGSALYNFTGSPEEVVEATVSAALAHLLRAIEAIV